MITRSLTANLIPGASISAASPALLLLLCSRAAAQSGAAQKATALGTAFEELGRDLAFDEVNAVLGRYEEHHLTKPCAKPHHAHGMIAKLRTTRCQRPQKLWSHRFGLSCYSPSLKVSDLALQASSRIGELNGLLGQLVSTIVVKCRHM